MSPYVAVPGFSQTPENEIVGAVRVIHNNRFAVDVHDALDVGFASLVIRDALVVDAAPEAVHDDEVATGLAEPEEPLGTALAVHLVLPDVALKIARALLYSLRGGQKRSGEGNLLGPQ